jgi:hypothetical protein
MPPSIIPSTSSAISSPGRRFGSSDQRRWRNGAAQPTRHDDSLRPRISARTPQLDSAVVTASGAGRAPGLGARDRDCVSRSSGHARCAIGGGCDIEGKPAFREAFQQRRRLAPVDNFYERKKTAAGKQPYAIALWRTGGRWPWPGVWETWRSPAGERARSFAIITTTRA